MMIPSESHGIAAKTAAALSNRNPMANAPNIAGLKLSSLAAVIVRVSLATSENDRKRPNARPAKRNGMDWRSLFMGCMELVGSENGFSVSEDGADQDNRRRCRDGGEQECETCGIGVDDGGNHGCCGLMGAVMQGEM